MRCLETAKRQVLQGHPGACRPPQREGPSLFSRCALSVNAAQPPLSKRGGPAEPDANPAPHPPSPVSAFMEAFAAEARGLSVQGQPSPHLCHHVFALSEHLQNTAIASVPAGSFLSGFVHSFDKYQVPAVFWALVRAAGRIQRCQEMRFRPHSPSGRSQGLTSCQPGAKVLPSVPTLLEQCFPPPPNQMSVTAAPRQV